MAGNLVPRTDGGSNLGKASKEYGTIYAKSLGGTLATLVAPLASPALTGVPTAPTAAAGTATTQIATTEFAETVATTKAAAVEDNAVAQATAAATITATNAVTTHNGDATAHSTLMSAHNTDSNAHKGQFDELKDSLANYVKVTSTTYKRIQLPGVSKTTVTIPAYTQVAVGDEVYSVTEDATLNLNDYVSASTRAGKDLYIYACKGTGGVEFVISANSTVPSGYTATTSRKIGGFHCLCADVGTISGHTLSGYVAGDILPLSVWDLLHRANSGNEGMVYVDGIRRWVDIYLSSWNGSELVSVYGGTCADGESVKKFHGELFVELLGVVGKKLINRSEFMVVAKGSNEGTNIYGSADAGTTGGHRDTSNRRMISNYGIEDCCGFMWQWTENLLEAMSTSYTSGNYYMNGYSWVANSVYHPDIDSRQYGSCAGLLRQCLVGGNWGDGAICGSRSAACNSFSARRIGNFGGRAVSEPRVVNL